jgi:molybdopterin converting factor small subunit
MQVIVRFTGPMRRLADRADERVPLPAGARLCDLLQALATTLPPAFVHEVVEPLQTGKAPTSLLLVNMANLSSRSGLDRPLSDGDIVAFVPPMAGG